MARRPEVAAVHTAGVVQGLALVTFPAASTVFTSPHDFALSSTAYGGLFVPQAVMAVAASLLEGALTRRLGLRRIYLLGLSANLLSMVLLFSSRFAMGRGAVAYAMLLTATTSLGIGFGLTVPALNTLTAAFFPQRIDSAVLGLNARLGLGTALAPIFVALFIHAGLWWGLPVLVAALLSGVLLFSLGLPLRTGSAGEAAPARSHTAWPPRFWLYAAFALLYGMVETMSGNWASVYMRRNLGTTTVAASLALAVFWAAVTAGRVLFAGMAKLLPPHRTFRLLPFVIAAAFVGITLVPEGGSLPGILAFGLAGLGCSALLPLTISFGQSALTAIAASVAGGLIAFYQVGYGVAAFGVGPLQEYAGLGLGTVFGIMALAALAMAALAFAIGLGGHDGIGESLATRRGEHV